MLRWSKTPKSSYYYHCKTGKRGRKSSTHTALHDGQCISNESVVIAIRFILAEEFVCFGYSKVTDDLRSNGFIINRKKTYRLMKEQRLLCGTVIRARGERRQFVQWRVQQAQSPMEQLCMDIKYVHVQGEKRNALLLTVLDVYSRSIVGQVLWWHMRKEHVIWVLHRILAQHKAKAITLRNDNGSQFIAHAVRDYLKENQVVQEFIHVATPEENCFIEAYHSIIQRELLEPRQFDSIEQAIEVFDRWKHFYNDRRLHGSLDNKTPNYVWQRYEQQMNKDQGPVDSTKALSTNGERQSIQIEESRLVDNIVRDQLTTIFENKEVQNSQTIFHNQSGL